MTPVVSLRSLAAAAALLCALPAAANESALRQAFQARFPNMAVESVTRTPYGGLYEVVFNGQIVYTDEKLSYLISGNLFDLRGTQERNVTRDRNQQLAAQALARSHELAVKRVRGSGKRVLYTFEDPNCGYCKELQKEINKLNDITVYTFLYPILSADSVEKSKAVWCAKDRARAWDDLMNKSALPAGKRDCDTPLEKTALLAQRFGIRGTPAIYLASGQQIGGYLQADKLEQALNAK